MCYRFIDVFGHSGCLQRSFIETSGCFWQVTGYVKWDAPWISFDINIFKVLLYRLFFLRFPDLFFYVIVRAKVRLSSERNVTWIVLEQLVGKFLKCKGK